jgi:hypothetical protein
MKVQITLLHLSGTPPKHTGTLARLFLCRVINRISEVTGKTVHRTMI